MSIGFFLSTLIQGYPFHYNTCDTPCRNLRI
nr:MAG TPA: hypothetical protein [Caudoviricetes sp.]